MTDPASTSISRTRGTSNAHTRSIEKSVTEIAATLQNALGQGLLAVIVGRDGRTVARWVAGEASPTFESEQRLRDTFQVFSILTSEDSPTVARAWFMGMNPQLDDETPAEVLAAGQARRVMTAARSFADAG